MLVVLTGCGSGDPGATTRDSSDTAIATAGATMDASQPPIVPATPVPDSQPNQAEVLFATSFDDESGGLIFVGETTTGAQASIADGRYVVEVADREWQTITVGGLARLRDGVIEADIALNGSGLGGLVARSLTDADGNNWMYVCLIDESGWAGCVASHGDTFKDLFWAEVDGYAPGAPQRLKMSVTGDRVGLTINGQVIGSAQDDSIQLGSWGVFAESLDATTTTVEFDNLTITRVQPGTEPPHATEESDRHPANATAGIV